MSMIFVYHILVSLLSNTVSSFLIVSNLQLAAAVLTECLGGDNKTGYTFLKVVLHIQQTQNNFDNPRLTFLFPPFSSPPSPEENLGVFGN